MKNRTIAAIILILILVVFFTCRNYNKNKEYEKESLETQIKSLKKELIEGGFKTQYLTIENLRFLKNLDEKDSLYLLYKQMYQYEKLKQGDIKIITNVVTKIDTILKNITRVDTFLTNDTINETIVIYPEYITDFNLDGWVYGTITSSKDSTDLKINVKNEFDIYLKNKNKELIVKNKNPYTITEDLNGLKIDIPQKSRFGVGIYTGFNIYPKPSYAPVIGVGLQYQLIRF